MNSKIGMLIIRWLLTAALGLAVSTPIASSAENLCTPSTAAEQISPPPGLWDRTEPVFYQPFLAMREEMERMNLEMSRLMQAAFQGTGNFVGGNQQVYSHINVETTPKEYRITMVEPGLDEKDMKVEVSQDHVLTIQSKKDMVQKTSGSTVAHSFGAFTQMMTLPEDADADHIQTSYTNNEYTVSVPRKGVAGNQPAEKPELQENGRSL